MSTLLRPSPIVRRRHRMPGSVIIMRRVGPEERELWGRLAGEAGAASHRSWRRSFRVAYTRTKWMLR